MAGCGDALPGPEVLVGRLQTEEENAVQELILGNCQTPQSNLNCFFFCYVGNRLLHITMTRVENYRLSLLTKRFGGQFINKKCCLIIGRTAESPWVVSSNPGGSVGPS